MTSSEQPGPEAGERKALATILERAKGARLTAAEEKEAAQLTKEALLSGKGGIGEAVGAMVQLPWVVGVEALNAAWPEMKPAAGRRQFLNAIADEKSDQAHRVRLSLARGLFASDSTAAIKMLLAVCEELRAPEGKLKPSDRAIFSQVLIGKAKPWLCNIALGELKEPEAAVLSGTALEVVGSCAPPAQESVLVWLAQAGQLKQLPEESAQALVKIIGRWQPKLRARFKESAGELPPSLAQALASGAEKPQQSPTQKKEKAERKPQPPREKQGFDLGAALRQIEAHVQELRGELQQAKNALRQREPRERAPKLPAGEVNSEELQRHNQQLQERLEELRQQLEDLSSHHEDVALSRSTHEDPTEQFKTLLQLKLQADYQDFQSLAKEPPDEVFREHYRILLENVFNILAQQGIDPGQPG